MNKFLFLCLVFCLSITVNILAGTSGKITGIVKDKKTGEPLFGASVVINGTSYGNTSDIEGRFLILNVPPGTYSVAASYIGYETLILSEVRVKIDQTTQLTFLLSDKSVEVSTVTITAERPPVELDLTASKQSVTSAEISNSWGSNVKDIISELPGVNANGGIRGGFGLDVAYNLNGMDMRDIGSNSNFTGVNLTTIQELEVLTGGWNAEYGQANGAMVNIVSKTASDRMRGTVSYKMRPAGVYHWGDNIYDQNNVFHTIMTTADFWDPTKTWQTQWMTSPLKGFDPKTLGAPYNTMTPQQLADWWKNFINDPSLNPQINYANRMDWESEFTIYGPIVEDLGFMLSGRYKEGVGDYPSALSYNPDMTFQGSLNYKFGSSKIDVNGIYTQFANSQSPRTYYGSSEDNFNNGTAMPFVRTPYNRYAYWFFGASSNSVDNIRPPEYASMLNLQAKFTHVFTPQTFLEVAVQHVETDYRSDFTDIKRAAIYGPDGKFQNAYPATLPNAFVSFVANRPGDIWSNKITSSNYVFKADLTSQVTKNHLVKTGLLFTYNTFDKVLHDHQSSGTTYYAHVTDLSETKSNPYEGAIYIQDKIEYEGMVINAGLRLDFYNANKNVSSTIFDPLMISDSTLGHTGPIGHISYDPKGTGPGYTKTPTQFAISPRIGISHPITESTVLHFMWGIFNQRPAWQKIVGPAVVRTLPPAGLSDWSKMDPEVQSVYYNFFTNYIPNPALEWEKMTQYEVGFEQNIADMFSLDVTMYYKDAYNLTSNGISRATTNSPLDNIAKTGGSVDVRLYGDPRDPANRVFGQTQGYFNSIVNGAWADVRGIESTIETKFRYVNLRFNYSLSFLTTGSNQLSVMYRVFKDANGNPKQLGIDQYRGASNTDGGRNGVDDDSWNPHNSATLKIMANSPSDFGPELGGMFLLGDWNISLTTSWAQGQLYTYHSPTDLSKEPNNMRWSDRWNTNMNLSKKIKLFGTMEAKLFINVINLFNEKQLNLLSGTDMTNYQELGQLPFNNTTKEPMVWDWYINSPREIYFGLQIDF